MTEKQLKQPIPQTKTKSFLLIISAESLLVFLALALHPSDPQSRRILLYSLPRFAEMLIALGMAGIATWGLKAGDKLKTFFEKELALYTGLSLFIISRLTLIFLQAFTESIDLQFLVGYTTQLKPLLFLLSLIGFEITLWTLFANKDVFLRPEKKYLYGTTILWLAITALSTISIFFEQILQLFRPTSNLYSFLPEWYIFLAWILLTANIILTLQEKKFNFSSNSFRNQVKIPISILLITTGILFQFIIQSTTRPYAKDQFYFQKWSSEDIMQTVSLEDLQKHPFETLNNIHLKPPALDTIRAVFVHMWQSPYKEMSLLHVDFLLYKLWTLLYGFLGAIIFLWLEETTNIKIAFVSSLIFFLHPANILYSTLLDSTFLTTFLFSLFYYLLWKTRRYGSISISLLSVATISLFFTRAIFQIPFLVLLIGSLFLLKVEKQKIFIFLLLTGSVFGLYTLKQYYKFGIFSTTSLTGLNLNRSVGNLDLDNLWGVDLTINENQNNLPSTLTRTKKINGQTNFNHINYIQFNQRLLEEFKEYIAVTPTSKILLSYWENLRIYFKPSSQYSTNIIVENLFWKNIYNKVFSTPILPALLVILGISGIITSIKEREYLRDIGLILPGLYVFAVTVLFEKGENMRFKFFIEPLLFIFIVTQLYRLTTQFKAQQSRSNKAIQK